MSSVCAEYILLTCDKSLKIHANRISFTGKLQGASVFMFSKSELFSQLFFKDLWSSTILKHLLVVACDVLYLLVLVSYRDSHIQMPFLKIFISQTAIAYYFLFTAVRADYAHYVKISLFSNNITVNVVWQNYFLTSMGDYMQPHISKCERTL